jgi:hypothetical protein
MQRIVLAAWISLVPAASSGQELPPEPPRPPTLHRHVGFFLRLDGALGYASSLASSPAGTEQSVSGFAIPFGVAAGWAVVENFVLAGELWGVVAPSPKVTTHGQTVSRNDSHLVLGGVGLNLTYYFVPNNIYLTVTPSAVMVGVTESGTLSRTQVGFGTKVAFGKEWWVADHWGLGVSAQFFFGLTDERGYDADLPTWKTFGGGIGITTTYN